MKKSKKKNELESGKRIGRAVVNKNKPLGLQRYEELLERMKALNLPPMDTVAEEKRIRAIEGF